MVANNGDLTFSGADQPQEGDEIVASYEVSQSACRDIELRYGNAKETYTVVDATDIERDVGGGGQVRQGVAVQRDQRAGDDSGYRLAAPFQWDDAGGVGQPLDGQRQVARGGL